MPGTPLLGQKVHGALRAPQAEDVMSGFQPGRGARGMRGWGTVVKTGCDRKWRVGLITRMRRAAQIGQPQATCRPEITTVRNVSALLFFSFGFHTREKVLKL